MSALLESTEALRHRAIEVGLTRAECDALVAQNVTSLARLAFAACPPGQTPTDDQVRSLFQPLMANQGTLSSAKRLIFEAQNFVVADVKSKVHKKDDAVTCTLAPAERENRIADQKTRLTGLRLRGEEECSYSSYDLVLSMMEKDTLIYLGPERFATRRSELLQKKPNKELTLDQSQVIVKDKQLELTCNTTTELELVNALRRRALAFDLVKLCPYDSMNSYHSELIEHLTNPSPPGYAPTSVQQVLRADRAAFLLMAEKLTTLKKTATGENPFEKSLQSILSHSMVSFQLLPMPQVSSNKTGTKPERKRSRSPKRQQTTKVASASKEKGKGKGKRPKGRGPNIPKALIGKALEAPGGKRLCWAFNLQGCNDAAPGQSCSKGVHLCAEPNCAKPRPMSQHPSRGSWLASPTAEGTAELTSRPVGFAQKVLGRTIHDLFCIEVFSGTGRLTAVLQTLGARGSFGVDHKSPRQVTSPLLHLDLLQDTQLELLKELMASPLCVYAHFAPPCGASSRARLIQRKGRWNPPILRTDQWPDGLPHLSGTLLARVQSANQLYARTCDLIRWRVQHDVWWSLENPNQAFTWDTKPLKQLRQDVPHFDVSFHHCQYGSSRRKCTKLLTNIVAFGNLQRYCTNDHPHEKWGQTSQGHWATSEETAYPWPLCRAMATQSNPADILSREAVTELGSADRSEVDLESLFEALTRAGWMILLKLHHWGNSATRQIPRRQKESERQWAVCQSMQLKLTTWNWSHTDIRWNSVT